MEVKMSEAALASNNATVEYLQRLANEGFWGAVTVKFEGGLAVHISRQESIIPSKLKDNPRKQNANFNSR